jgi:hypothetical protein
MNNASLAPFSADNQLAICAVLVLVFASTSNVGPRSMSELIQYMASFTWWLCFVILNTDPNQNVSDSVAQVAPHSGARMATQW